MTSRMPPRTTVRLAVPASVLRSARQFAVACGIVSGLFVPNVAWAQAVADAPTALDKAILTEAEATVKAFNSGRGGPGRPVQPHG